jgi:hypothetical protein
MPIKTTCPHCDKAYTFVDTLGGKKIRCKSCEEVFRVPPPNEGDERPAAVRTSPSKRRAARLEEGDEVEDVVAADDQEDDYDDRPSRRRPARKAKGGIPLWVWLAAGGSGGVLLIVLVVVLVLALGGGGNRKVTMENYRQLKQGMSEGEVTAVLGSPDEKKDEGPSAKVWVWKNGESTIRVTFTNGKVTGLRGDFVNTR